MIKLKVGTFKKVKILAILFSIFLIGCFASSRPSNLRSEPDGFRDIMWGTEIATLKDMEKVEQNQSSNSNLVWYTRKGDTLSIGKVKLENIFYSFWMGKFKSVWIDFKGDENFETLKKELFEQFGNVLESEKIMRKKDKMAGRDQPPIELPEEFYGWWGKNTDMSLSYSKDRHKGTLYIISRMVGDGRRHDETQEDKEKKLK